MKKILLPFIFCLLLTNCATILKKKTYDLSISSNEKNAKVKVYDSIYDLPNKVKVIRSNLDLDLILITDTLNIDYKIKSSPNPTFLYLNLVGMQMAPLNYAVDFTNKKRFYYGKNAYLNSKDSLRIIEPPVSKFYTDFFAETYPKNKNDINLVFSIPYVNGFYFKPQGYGTKSNTGFFGISAGIEYFYKSNKYFNFNTTASTDFLAPVPAPVHYDSAYDKMNSIYFSLTDNFKIKRFSIGYGLNYSINNWTYIDDSDIENEIEIKRKNKSIGLTADVYFQFGKSFFVGLIYRPTFYNLKPKAEFEYEHLISLDFAFKIPLRKK
ncbi:hypothetical protein [Xanthomarina sp. F2636L]|uniref:hypothetical protein n=1 Tax=Xanthomarina sp. F2636L TaxID=2996018 RepID=UPI00225DEDD1|nr:hypothetical protein [Xanthomarina sp. F2636L]MCX7552237.1 hypothetical protein [Xanthomarina sp. F2636L]